MENYFNFQQVQYAKKMGQNAHNTAIFDLTHHDSTKNQPYRLKAGPDSQILLIWQQQVVWLAGGVLLRKLSFEAPLINCFFTRFADKPDIDVLVVVFEDKIKIYESHGSHSVVNFPVNIQNAFATADGIIVSRKYDQQDQVQALNTPTILIPAVNDNVINSPSAKSGSSFLPSVNPESNRSASSTMSFVPHPPIVSGNNNLSVITAAPAEANFLTLSDTFGEMGLVVTSSTTTFGLHEQLTSYPSSSLQCLATTFNPGENKITVYYARKLSTKKINSGSNKKFHHLNLRNSNNKRISSTGSVGPSPITPSTSMIHNANNTGNNNINNNATFNNIFDTSVNYNRTVSNPLMFDRILSGAVAGAEHHTDSGSIFSNGELKMKKDIIFTKLDSFDFDSEPRNIKIFNVNYQSKEAVVIVNTEAQLIEIVIYTKDSFHQQPRMTQSYTIPGVDAVEFETNDGHDGYIVILNQQGEIFFCHLFFEIYSTKNPITSSNIPISLDSCSDYTISFKSENGEHYTHLLPFKPMDKLVKTLIESLKYLVHYKYFEIFWIQWWSNLVSCDFNDEWKSYVVTLLSFIISDQAQILNFDSKNEISKLIPSIINLKEEMKTRNPNAGIGTFAMEPELLTKIFLSIHVIREDMKLNILAISDMDKLSIFLAQMSSWIRLSPNWINYYGIDIGMLDKGIQLNSSIFRISEPPNVLLSIGSLFDDDSELIQYLPFSMIASEDDILDSKITPRTYQILKLFEILVSPNCSNHYLVQMMVEFGINSFNLETFPPGIFLVLKNTLLLCRKTFSSNKDNMSIEMIKLIGREDLVEEKRSPKLVNSKKSNLSSLMTIHDIINPIFNDKILNAWDNDAEAEVFNITKSLFNKDRRFYDLTKVLQTSKIQKVNNDTEKNLIVDESIKLERQRYIASKIALRTMTIPIGRGMVFNNSRKPLPTEGFPIPKMNFNTVFLPDNITVTVDSVELCKELVDWGYFHNGVSSGLTVSKNFENEITGSWIVFNRPPKLNAQHAGFLLGLGLNGHLKKMEEWHIYNYLSPKHSFTSIAMLIGMSASLKGSMDLKLTKVLSIHIVALLPQGSTNLNVKLSVQTAGLIGIGLLYLNSQHRRMSEMLLNQINCFIEINDKKVVSEGYQLAAGISFGFINLGRGDELKYNNGSYMIDQLINLSIGIRDVETSEELNKSSSGSIMALMFLFIKTNNEEISRKLLIPDKLQLMDYIRPDLFLLRILSFNMIMWDQIGYDDNFIRSQIPKCLEIDLINSTIEELLDDDNILSYLNILGGVILSIGIKYASSQNMNVKQTLLNYLDKLIKLSLGNQSEYYDERITLITIKNITDITCISLSIVMSSSGDLDIFKRLRFLHQYIQEAEEDGDNDYSSYGNYMAINTSLGFLFLGGGQQAFKLNDLFSIVSLIVSIYPIYCNNNNDLRDDNGEDDMEINLQVMRHFWSMSVENRCLKIKDINNDELLQNEVEIYLYHGQIFKMESPCLLPEFDEISKIVSKETNDYLAVEINFDEMTEDQLNDFKDSCCIYVNRQMKYSKLGLQYDEIVHYQHKHQDEEEEEEDSEDIESDDIYDEYNSEELYDFEKSILKTMIMKDKNLINMTIIDFKVELTRLIKTSQYDNQLNLNLIFKFIDKLYLISKDEMNGQDEILQYLNKDFINNLRNEMYLKLV